MGKCGLRSLFYLHIDAVEKVVERALLDGDARRSALRLRQTERPSVEPFVTHRRMQLLQVDRRALCASRTRTIPSPDGSSFA